MLHDRMNMFSRQRNVENEFRACISRGASFLQLLLHPLLHRLVEERAGERRKPLSLTLSPLARGEGIQKCATAIGLQILTPYFAGPAPVLTVNRKGPEVRSPSESAECWP